ncbi:hypothetical protein RIR_jg36334.t1 [Rhizophagus irregularis DAOM 181602=DAOM 197198]|uniref:Uncharacterized protein n=1 Tax=Rhizophagus irregularis (strain DAOM 181602 / DAOM 197198 / MUCL 43194) TaxID=747089 RepID=U9TU51_RHIID|nr:hypothetical protein RIR_jg36334.t1 [Rhizophagus irregularis DAOM 181602=DAOM 197198]
MWNDFVDHYRIIDGIGYSDTFQLYSVMYYVKHMTDLIVIVTHAAIDREFWEFLLDTVDIIFYRKCHRYYHNEKEVLLNNGNLPALECYTFGSLITILFFKINAQKLYICNFIC